MTPTDSSSTEQASQAASAALAAKIAASLDQSELRLDPAVTASLAELRRQALQQHLQKNHATQFYRYSFAQWAAVAAMMALCAVTLGMSYQLRPQANAIPVVAMNSAMPVYGKPVQPMSPKATDPLLEAYREDPEMLADWEMLDAIGEDPDAT